MLSGLCIGISPLLIPDMVSPSWRLFLLLLLLFLLLHFVYLKLASETGRMVKTLFVINNLDLLNSVILERNIQSALWPIKVLQRRFTPSKHLWQVILFHAFVTVGLNTCKLKHRQPNDVATIYDKCTYGKKGICSHLSLPLRLNYDTRALIRWRRWERWDQSEQSWWPPPSHLHLSGKPQGLQLQACLQCQIWSISLLCLAVTCQCWTHGIRTSFSLSRAGQAWSVPYSNHYSISRYSPGPHKKKQGARPRPAEIWCPFSLCQEILSKKRKKKEKKYHWVFIICFRGGKRKKNNIILALCTACDYLVCRNTLFRNYWKQCFFWLF